MTEGKHELCFLTILGKRLQAPADVNAPTIDFHTRLALFHLFGTTPYFVDSDLGSQQ